MFKNQKRNAQVKIFGVREREGKYEDGYYYYIGTLIKNQEDMTEMTIMAKLKDDDCHKFEQQSKKGDLFRFESAISEKTERFFEDQEHKEHELFEHTLYRNTENGVEDLTLMDLIDSRMMPEGEIKDRGSQKYILNEDQYSALKMALNEKRELVCIQGPAGTGKTFVLAHLLATLQFRKKKAIVLTPTREALENIMKMTEKVIKENNIPYHDKSLMDSVKFGKAVNDSPAAENARRQFAQWEEELRNKKLEFEAFYALKKNLINSTFAEAGNEIMKQTSIVFATISSNFVNRAMRYKIFDPCMCVIDHAAQVMETQTWPAVLKMKRLVLAGDPKQFLPFVLPSKAKAAKLEKSIMDRIIHNKERFSWIMLTEQYRCHPAISVWSNKSFYGRALKDKTDPNKTIHKSFKANLSTLLRTLFDPVVFVDTSAETDPKKRVDMYELVSEDSYSNELGNCFKSFKNKGEAELVMTHYKHLRDLGIQAETIVIITPYQGQIDLIKEKMEIYIQASSDFSCKQTKIGTANILQGQEYDCVLFSMVRSNPRKVMGLACDLRRLNVVITRAKRHLMFIGNGYLMANSFYKEIRDLFHEFISTRHRFHPKHVGYNHAELKEQVTNNFGYNFEDFVKTSNDPEMKEWCARYVLRQSDPKFIQQRQEKKASRNKAGQNRNK